MSEIKKIKSALISVFSKDGLDELVLALSKHNVQIISTGGTQKHIESLGISVTSVEEVTSYPSILGGRVKTLHPKIFGGILSRRENKDDGKHLSEFEIPEIDLVIVDLYPFDKTVSLGASHSDIIEKIDIGGVSLIRAAAKNYEDITVISHKSHYKILVDILTKYGPNTLLDDRKKFAYLGFKLTTQYDSSISQYLFPDTEKKELRYGENPHQKGWFLGNLNDVFNQLHGKAISYNNLLDIDAAVMLMADFNDSSATFGILKHNNACGFASRELLLEAYKSALESDPISAFGGVLIANKTIDYQTAEEINKLFFEIVIAPAYSEDALELLKSKKNRIILQQKLNRFEGLISRTCLNGNLIQERDSSIEEISTFEAKTKKNPTKSQLGDLFFANKLVKHTKSNTIVLAKEEQLLSSGTGQTSRVDALKQAIHKAKSFGFDLNGAVMASDAFFPFPDCVEIAGSEGISAVIQPGGSLKDQLSIDYCDENGLAMVFTGVRHFKH